VIYKKKVTVLIVLTALLIYIISPLNILHNKAFASGVGSTIGSVDVTDLKEEDLRQVLTDAIVTYQSQALTITGGGVTEELDLSSLQYDVEATIAEYKNLTDKPWYAFWQKKKVVNLPIQVAPNEGVQQQIAAVPQWDAAQTYANTMLIASYLRSHEVEAVVNAVINIDEERLAVAIAPVPVTSTDIQTAVDALNERVLAPNEEFSYLNEMAPVLGSLNRETINFVASLLYEAALNVNAQLVERHSNVELPTDVQPGLDAFVSFAQGKDLRFLNVKDQAIQLNVTREGVNLKMEFFAARPDESATIRVAVDQEIEPRTITRFTYDLAYGRTQLVSQGTKGTRVTVYSTNNATGEEKVISKDYYPPTNTVVLKSARPAPVASGSTDPSDPNYNPDANGGTDSNNNPDGSIDNPDGSGSNNGSGNGNSNSGGTGGTNGSGDVDENGNPVKYDKAGNIIN
jgi:hypothetical protein